MAQQPDHPPRRPDGALVEVEALQGEPPARSSPAGVRLSGEAARDVIDSLGSAVVVTTKLPRRGAGNAYRIVASESAREGLADGSLRWATASRGDASILIKDAESGGIAAHGELHRVRTSPAKVLGPVVWEAMAMATQQHFLVEIDNKLRSIGKGVADVLARGDADKRGTLAQVRKIALGSRERLDGGGTLSEARIRELQDGVQRADEVWHQLHDRMTTELAEYRAGNADRTTEEVEHSWAMLLDATQVLAECSVVLTMLQYESADALETVRSEEVERVRGAIVAVRGLAAKLHGTHSHWADANATWLLQRTRNPARNVARAVRRSGLPRPAQKPLDFTTAWHASQLTVPPRSPAALVVSVDEDGSVEVAASS